PERWALRKGGLVRRGRHKMPAKCNVSRCRAEGAAVTLAVEQPHTLAGLQSRHAVAGLVDNPRAIAVRDHARIFHRAIAATAAADIGGSDTGGFEAGSHLARRAGPARPASLDACARPP